MRPIALVGLLSLAVLAFAGCGSSSAPTPTEPAHITTAAQVAEMTKRLERDEELRPVLKAERAECEAVVSEYEWGPQCIDPEEEKLAHLTVLDETLANELSHKAGKGCREALRAGPYYDAIDAKTVAGCKADIGKKPEENQ
jgi:hypothetical protein